MNFACLANISVCQGNSMISQYSSSSDVEMEVQSPQCFQHLQGHPESFVQPMFIPYIEGSKIDLTANDSLYHRVVKLKLKCENILDCELAMFPESNKCKKVIVWSGDFGMDQYVSWCLPTEDLSLELFVPSMNIFANHRPMKLEPDLTCWQALDKVISQLVSGTILLKLKCLLPSTHQKLQVSFIEVFSDFS